MKSIVFICIIIISIGIAKSYTCNTSTKNSTCTLDRIRAIESVSTKSVQILLESGKEITYRNDNPYRKATHYVNDTVCVYPNGEIKQ